MRRVTHSVLAVIASLPLLSISGAHPAEAQQDDASAQVEPSLRPQVVSVRWARRPSMDEIAAAYPTQALAAGVSGDATVQCQVGRDGLLSACSVRSETPGELGFGEAALSLVPRFRAQVGADHAEGATLSFRLPWNAPSNDQEFWIFERMNADRAQAIVASLNDDRVGYCTGAALAWRARYPTEAWNTEADRWLALYGRASGRDPTERRTAERLARWQRQADRDPFPRRCRITFLGNGASIEDVTS